MSELPNREMKRNEFINILKKQIGPGFGNEDMDFLLKEHAKRHEICEEICTERMFQIATWGKDPYPVYKGLSVLTEEVGEANQATLEDLPQKYRSELVQVAAVCMRLIEELDGFDLDDSFGGTREALPEADEWRALTEPEKAAIVLDEMSRSDDPLKRQGVEAISVMMSAKVPDFGPIKEDLAEVDYKPTGNLSGKIQVVEKLLDKQQGQIEYLTKRLGFVIESVAERFERLEQPSQPRPYRETPIKKPMQRALEIRALPLDGSIEPHSHYLFEDPSGDFKIQYMSSDLNFFIPPGVKVYKLEISK